METGTILIVEDDESIRAVMKLALEMEGYVVLTAANGKEALTALAGARPGLILLDLMMPVMDGWTFAAELERAPALPRPPIVLMTAFAERAGRLPGVRCILRKPFELPAMLATVRCWSAPV